MRFIDIKNCSKVYKNGVTAIANLDLEISRGEFVFVIGQTASGKSTLIKMLYREERPTKGTVIVGGINVAKLRNSKIYKLRRKLGVVFQDFKLLPKLTVYENVAFGLETLGLKDKEKLRNTLLKESLILLLRILNAFMYFITSFHLITNFYTIFNCYNTFFHSINYIFIMCSHYYCCT